MGTIKLDNGVWTLHENQPLGAGGGFGEVFNGSGPNGDVAIKRLKLSAGAAAHRELNIGKSLGSRTLVNVVPVLDQGQDADTDRYFLVMPLCEYSLQDRIRDAGVLTWEETKTAALDIINGLREVSDIVHRDLKPANVLWHEGRWKVADFGIAKFVEDATSLDTLRDSLTPPYGAPEQWRGERPTTATDVYALGCIIYAMVTGRPPFQGDFDAIRKAHLNDMPAELKGVDPRINGLVQTMLRKSPASRPSLDRCATVLASVTEKPLRSSGHALAKAGSAIAEAEAAEEAVRQTAEATKRERAALSKEAISELNRILQRLFDEIVHASPTVRRETRLVQLGPAQLITGDSEPVMPSASPYDNGWDIAAFSKLTLQAAQDLISQYDPAVYTFAVSLVYARAPKETDYRWHEMSFWTWNSRAPMSEAPVALSPRDREFQLALSNVVSGWQLAHGPLKIDAEDEDNFQDRWVHLFAKAAQKKLRPPSSLPLSPEFFK